MATFRKRAKEQWQAQVRVKGFPPCSHTFRTRSEAEAWASIVESEFRLGTWRPSKEADTTTLAQCLDRYEIEISPRKKGKSQEISRLRQLKTLPIAPRFMGSIRSSEIAKWRDDRMKCVSASTANRELALLSHVFTIANKEWGMEGLDNPVLRVRKAKLPSGRIRRPSTDEIDAILKSSKSIELKLLIRLALETAMRRGEICSLKWADVDLGRSLLTLRDSKNGESRLIPLSERARTLLEQLSTNGLGKVFKMRPDSITQAFSRACSRAGIEDLRFHDLRHEATSRFIEKGLSVMEAVSITGHKDLRMLLRYTHLRPEAIISKLN
jgi:integrase